MTMNAENLPDVLTGSEVADIFRVSQGTVSRWRREGRLDRALITTPGRRYLYRTADILAICHPEEQDTQA